VNITSGWCCMQKQPMFRLRLDKISKSYVGKTYSCLMLKQEVQSVISDFRRYIDEICALLGCYAASSGNLLPTFRDNVSLRSSRVRKSSWPLKVGPIRCQKPSEKDYHSTLRNTAEECRPHTSSSPCFKKFRMKLYVWLLRKTYFWDL
jgi:hypothetical protein